MLKGKKILVGITGGIAAYKICNLVRLFIKAGAEVRVVMTPSATKFVSALTLSVLTKHPVIVNMFTDKKAQDADIIENGTWHIDYGIWPDIFLIAPATANTIAKVVCGISDNFLLSAILASRCQVVFAPTMDEDMYKNQITQANINKLISYGYKIIEPIEGELASGINGMGKMPEPEDIFTFVKKILLKKKDLENKNILITAGPTVEPIDPVRYISNHSSGKMGFEIARAAYERGANVTLITGPVNLTCSNKIKRVDVKTTDDMFNAVKINMRKKDLIIMTAAVSDYKPAEVKSIKIKKVKTENHLDLKLEKTKDILEFLGKNKIGFKLFGFALETDNDVNNAKKKLISKNADMIVLNNPLIEGSGFGVDTNIVTFVDRKKMIRKSKMTKYDVANEILDYYLSN